MVFKGEVRGGGVSRRQQSRMGGGAIENWEGSGKF